MKLVMWIIFEIDFDDVFFLRMFINKVWYNLLIEWVK